MLHESGYGVGGQPDDDHGEHVHACHEGVVVLLGWEVECDPEGEDGEAEEATGEDD